jgi:hypothetical protein
MCGRSWHTAGYGASVGPRPAAVWIAERRYRGVGQRCATPSQQSLAADCERKAEAEVDATAGRKEFAERPSCSYGGFVHSNAWGYNQ